jgi:hypothetical protein
MADDLTANLNKVKKSQGKKRLFFAYGTGKRKDGKGEGALLVATRKPKKEQVEEECPCAEFFDGFCWSSDNGETIYFGSKKKLGGAMIAKMMLTVKKTTGRQFEFAAPSPEEEARAEKLGASEETETEGEEGAGPAKEHYEGLRSTILLDLARLLKSDPNTGAKIQHIVEAAATHAGQGEYAKAVTFLEQAAKALAAAAGVGRTTEAKSDAPQGKVGLEVLRVELHNLRVQAIGGIAKVTAKLGTSANPDAPKVVEIVKRLAQQMPGELEGILRELDKAVQENDTAAVTKHRAQVKKSATDWLAFLQENQHYIACCETNPWGIAIQIDKPIRASLAAILKTAQ